MIKLFLKTSLRHIKRNPWNATINIIGLALGFTVALVSTLWILKQFSFDKNFQNYDTIYQVMVTGTFNDEMSTGPSTSIPLAKWIESDFKNEMEQVTLSTGLESTMFKAGDKKLSANGCYALGKFSEIFSFQTMEGEVSTPIDANTFIISQSLASRLFGNQSAIGKIVQLNGKEQYLVKGVYADLPHNSTFYQLDYILPIADYLVKNEGIADGWNNCYFNTYVQVTNSKLIPTIESKLTAVFKTKLTDINPQILLHPMEKWHLYESFKNGKNNGGQIQYVWMFALISCLILSLACINFINLSTARSLKRGKEVGVLKSFGVNRKQLIQGFLVESVCSVGISFVFSILFTLLLLPWINKLTHAQLELPLSSPLFYAISFAGIFVIGLLAGIYPSIFLSSFNPILALKGKLQLSKGRFQPRKVMVVIQFAISIFMMIATYLVIQQLYHVKERPIGYNNQNLINVISSSPEIRKNFEVLKRDLQNKGLIQDATLSSNFVNRLGLSGGGFTWEGNDPIEGSILGIFTVDESFGNTVGWNFLKGRNFSKDFKTDSSGVIINEAAAKFMGLTSLNSKTLSKRGKTYEILGVIENTISESPFKSITPTAYFLDFLPKNKITIRLKDHKHQSQTLKAIGEKFMATDPNLIFEYTFTDQAYAKEFTQMEMIRSLTSLFTGLAILISCIGLYALVSFLTEQREKEIGIRKVLGASEIGLWRLLSTEYIWLTLIGFLIAAPLAYLFMEKWLENYVYRISINWSIFIVTGSIALLITLVTVSFQAIKAALSNPIDTLRNE